MVALHGVQPVQTAQLPCWAPVTSRSARDNDNRRSVRTSGSRPGPCRGRTTRGHSGWEAISTSPSRLRTQNRIETRGV